MLLSRCLYVNAPQLGSERVNGAELDEVLYDSWLNKLLDSRGAVFLI
jgi:hypothetical protein